MSSQAPELGPRDVRAVVDSAWGADARHEAPDLVLLRGRPTWTGDDLLAGPSGPVRVCTATSPLAVLDLIGQHAGERLLVLTDLEEAELGSDLLARAHRAKVVRPEPWDAVSLAFRVTRSGAVDPLLVREGAPVAQALLEMAPAEGWPPPASGIVTRDHALRCLTTHVLGTPREVDAAGILDWSTRPEGGLALRDLPEEVRASLVRWLVERAGPAVRPVLRLAEKGEGPAAVVLGLVSHLALQAAGGGFAKGSVSARLGQPALGDHELRAWAELAQGWTLRQLATRPAVAAQVLADADEEARQLRLEQAVAESDLLPSGLLVRLQECADALAEAAGQPTSARVARVERAHARVARHVLASEDPASAAVRMAVRLVRWLATRPEPAGDLGAALVGHVAGGGWVDLARQVVANGVADGRVAAGLATVHQAASALRSAQDRAAATQLAASVRDDAPPGGVVPVEEAAERLVRPLRSVQPVLLVVVDGMSAAVAAELVMSAQSRGWRELRPDAAPQRAALLAGLPTVTEVSRTSLLTGRRARGTQREERTGVEDAFGRGTVVLHLGDLESTPGEQLPYEVRATVQSGEHQVVVVVLNGVDDSLSGGDPARTRWTVDAVRHLGPLLEGARTMGRAVVLTSDHGHVVDQGPGADVLFQRSGAGARWRAGAGADVGEDEVRLAGPRVLLGDGDVVAAVGERLRYKQRSEGYHGGAALAELAIPFVVLAHSNVEVEGWRSAPASAPAWWDAPVEVEESSDSDDQGRLFG
ncbi:BREX-2 system phosphatase PglZ [Nocardioides sp. GY 10127]|uniref:BREX-2 system phosphatase PglZ n=1 Tax=Nocardioides sp. GY 10127 TaxID=2569762 RepID=UPI0014585023|nr:BREX-2 system phosphatase PglZ [Nocardioides sp. GY 10127]